MRGLWLIFAVLCLLLQSAPDARAYKFGSEDRVRVIQDVGARGPNGEALYLGYKMTVQNVFFGIYIGNGGYILGVRGDSKNYYNLPPAQDMERLQRARLLPNPLPPYRMDFADYLYGYLFWPILALIIIAGMWMDAVKRARQEADRARQEANGWANTQRS
jgi:hypothetical protein